MDYQNLAEQYLASKKNSWTAATMKSESSRMKALIPFMQECPESLWKSLSALGSYSRITAFSRAVAFQDFINSTTGEKVNRLELWRKSNQLLFKNQYNPRKVEMTYEEAKTRIQSIKEEAVREKALQLLSTAQRWSESVQPVEESGSILGKGSKRRLDLRNERELPGVSHSRVYRALKAIGLTPHLLRKLALTRAAENGAQPADLMAIAGWSSIAPAAFYLQPKDKERLKAFLV